MVDGDPAKLLKLRECVHSFLVVESLQGGDISFCRVVREVNNV